MDFSVLESIEQRDVIAGLERKPEMTELIRAVRVMRGEAAPGESGEVGRCVKHCSAEALESILEVLHKFWGAEQDNPQWHIASLSIIYKGKGKQGDLNNFRGVALQDMMARIMSAIISKRLLDGPIAKYGIQAHSSDHSPWSDVATPSIPSDLFFNCDGATTSPLGRCTSTW